MCTLEHRMVQKELSTKDFWYKSWAQAVIGGSPKARKQDGRKQAEVMGVMVVGPRP